MGLDIYLRKCADLPAALGAERSADEEKNALWESHGEYDKIPEHVKEAVRKACETIEAKHGCTGKWGRHHSIEEFDSENSSTDPSHLFKLGYFRSSYNEGGIERVMRQLGLPGLHDIFQPPEDAHDFAPDWNVALDRCATAIHGYEAHLASDTGKYRVTLLRPMFDYGVKTEQEALAMFAEQLRNKREAGHNSYSNRDGEFYLDGMKAVAFITKTYERPANAIEAFIGGPSVFVVYEQEPPADGKADWYLTALRIVKETIEFVLAQPDKQHFYLVWSG